MSISEQMEVFVKQKKKFLKIISLISFATDKLSLEQRVKVHEAKVKIIKEIFEVLKKISISRQMEGIIRQKKQILKIISLINSVSDKPSLDFKKEEKSIINTRQAKSNINNQIKMELRNVGTLYEYFPVNPRYFDYEVESGMVTNPILRRKEDNELTKLAGKGLRITAYNGFESDIVIIPNEIDGQPVISIGEKVFRYSQISEVILPKSIKAILSEAFSECKNLKHIDLPDTVEYLWVNCFSYSGIVEFVFPNALTKIPYGCCWGCTNLNTVTMGSRVNTICLAAFEGCTKLQNVLLSESLSRVEKNSFRRTAITTIIFPCNVKEVSSETFGDGYTENENKVTCVFFGKDTTIMMGIHNSFHNVSLIYCLPGSKIQQIAREKQIPIKPVSEFRMEN